MSTAAIRALVVDDKPAWRALLAALGDHPWSERHLDDELVGRDRHALGAFDEDTLVGAIAIARVPAAAEVWIHDVTVAPHARRRGVGAALVREALSLGHAHASSVWLEVRATNAPAIALYRGLGFVDVAVRRGYYAPSRAGQRHEDAIVMRADP